MDYEGNGGVKVNIENKTLSFYINKNMGKVGFTRRQKEHEEKLNKKSNIIKAYKNFKQDESKGIKVNLGNKNKSDKSDFINEITERNSNAEERIEHIKENDFNHLMKMEKRKDEIAKGIQDLCKDKREMFLKWTELDGSLSNILMGNVDSVLSTMNYDKVAESISNVQLSISQRRHDELKKYYDGGYNKMESYEQYRKDRGESVEVDENNMTDEEREQFESLNSLKRRYKNLFKIDEDIKNFKKQSKEHIEKIEENIKKTIGNININHNLLDNATHETRTDGNK